MDSAARRRALLAVSLTSTLTAACSWLPLAPRSIPDCPGAIESTDEMPGDFTNRLWVAVTSDDVNFPFELIAQKKGRELVLIGLSPLGAKLFSVVQRGVEARVDALPGAALPVPPLNVLRDFHRFRLTESKAATDAQGRVVFDHADCDYTIAIETLGAEAQP